MTEKITNDYLAQLAADILSVASAVTHGHWLDARAYHLGAVVSVASAELSVSRPWLIRSH